MPGREWCLLNLANALCDRSRSFGTAENARKAANLYRAALASPLVTPELGMVAARNWTWAATERLDWPEVAEAALAGLDAIDRLVKIQLTRAQKESWLRDARDLSSSAAFALAKVDRLAEAAVTLEASRARLLTEAFALGGAGLSDLDRAGRPDLADRYATSAHRVRQLALEADGLVPLSVPAQALAADQRQALTDLEKLIAEIREIPGFAHFLSAPTINDIFNAAIDAPVVYVAATEQGDLALVASGRSRTVQNVWLPVASSELLDRITPYVDGLAAGSLGTDLATIDELCQWLWDAVAGPLVTALGTPPEIVLVPVGWLALLPLHAAWYRDPSAPANRCYLVDKCAVTYAANARARAAAKERASRTTAANYLVVEDPRPTSAGVLSHAAQEADAVLDGVPGLRLKHELATKARVRSALNNYSVLHFACHGSVNPSAPLNSRLLLAHDELLTVGEVITDRLERARLAVLSACETAIVGAALMDEVVNFPTGMIQAGAAGCIGSLWQVSDAATALLMRRFYEIWRSGITPGEALRRAQVWLRDVSNEELVAGGYITARHISGATMVESFWRSARIYSHPFYWAAFAFSGA
jgi:CHAT domain-containing protein